jgi:hypothetical protein
MHVVIVGAGALGTVYGARLARFGGCEVSVVARTAGPPKVARLERVDDGDVLHWEMPARLERAPARADVVMACVRYDQLGALPARLEGGRAPIIVMTPMMPGDHSRLSSALVGRVRAGMPSVVSYENGARAVRYWLPRVATTLIEAREADGPEVELVKRLERADISARGQEDVLERNVATTVSFIPIAMALDVAGSIEGVLRDEALLALAFDAAEEGRELGRAVGKAEAWAALLLRFVGPFTLKVAVSAARARAEEAVRYVEQHFGRKLHAQNVAMAAQIVELAKEKGTPHASLSQLLEKLRMVA